MAAGDLFLGLDLSTQSVSSLVINGDGRVVHRSTVNFDEELPTYGTANGMNVNGSVVTSPVGMWLDGVDMLFSRIEKELLQRLVAVSASAQQHGSVYWGQSAEETLKTLDSTKSLKKNLEKAFVLQECPIWADSSTDKQCRRLEEQLGGAEAVASITGTCAQHRFTGNQIAKIAEEQPQRWEECVRVSLVSSFVTSLLIGAFAPIDYSDGSGMNLMDLRSKRWHDAACAAAAPALKPKLGPDPVHPRTVTGTVSRFWTDKYGLPGSCRVVCSSGDNPCSIVGMQLQPGEVAVSLGTSDVLIGITSRPAPSLHASIMPHPTLEGGYFVMLVFKNGAVARTALRDTHCNGSWQEFDNLLDNSEPGNGGKLVMHVLLDEITPKITAKGAHREDESGAVRSSPFSSAEEVRGAVEARAMAMRLHAARSGIAAPTRVRITGGTAHSTQVCKVFSSVFGCDVAVSSLAVSDAAALGAALRAQHATSAPDNTQPAGDGEGSGALTVVASAEAGAGAPYSALLPRLANLEARVAAMA